MEGKRGGGGGGGGEEGEGRGLHYTVIQQRYIDRFS